jgi:hypothetical protein
LAKQDAVAEALAELRHGLQEVRVGADNSVWALAEHVRALESFAAALAKLSAKNGALFRRGAATQAGGTQQNRRDSCGLRAFIVGGDSNAKDQQVPSPLAACDQAQIDEVCLEADRLLCRLGEETSSTEDRRPPGQRRPPGWSPKVTTVGEATDGFFQSSPPGNRGHDAFFRGIAPPGAETPRGPMSLREISELRQGNSPVEFAKVEEIGAFVLESDKQSTAGRSDLSFFDIEKKRRRNFLL